MRLIFMGTPEFSVPALDALIAAGHDVAAVYTQPPRRAGRGKKDRPGPVHMRALAQGLPVRHPVSLRDADAQAEFAAFGADIAVVVAYGLILPKAVLDAPVRGCLNIHASLLPRWRGAAPIHRAIMAGDTQTGVCIMAMEEGLDTGPVLLRREVPIDAHEATGDLHDRLARVGAAAIVETLERLDDLTPQPQPQHGVSYADKIDKAEARIDWTRPAAQIDRQIRGLSPFPGAWSDIGTPPQNARIKLLGSRCVHGPDSVSEPGHGSGQGSGAMPGTVVGAPLIVACGDGAVSITRAQRAGKAAQDIETFLRGCPLPPGTAL